MQCSAVVPGDGMIRGRPNPRHQTIARRLKLARLAREITPSRLALTAGLSNPAVRRIEEEGRVPGVDVVERLARVLRTSPGWLAFDVRPAPLPAAGEEAAALPPAGPDAAVEGAPLLCAGLGERLRGLREERGLPRKALARLVGLADTPIRMTEEGRTLPSVATLEQIAKGLGVSPAWLAYGEGPQVLPKVPRKVRRGRTAASTPRAFSRRRSWA